MNRRSVLAQGLAIAGAVLTWFPIIAPVVLSVVRFAQTGRWMIDYLMPAELLPVALLGGVLLFWAAILAHSHRARIGWSLGAAVGLLILSMGLAVVTGLASGAAEASGWRLALVAGLLGGYIVALVVLGVSGVSLVRAVMKRPSADAAAPA